MYSTQPSSFTKLQTAALIYGLVVCGCKGTNSQEKSVSPKIEEDAPVALLRSASLGKLGRLELDVEISNPSPQNVIEIFNPQFDPLKDFYGTIEVTDETGHHFNALLDPARVSPTIGDWQPIIPYGRIGGRISCSLIGVATDAPVDVTLHIWHQREIKEARQMLSNSDFEKHVLALAKDSPPAWFSSNTISVSHLSVKR